MEKQDVEKGVRKLSEWNKAKQRQTEGKNERMKTDWKSEISNFARVHVRENGDFDLRLSNVSYLERILPTHFCAILLSLSLALSVLNICERLCWTKANVFIVRPERVFLHSNILFDLLKRFKKDTNTHTVE